MRELKFRAFIDGEMVILPFAALQYFDFEGSYVLSFAIDGYDGFWGHEHYESVTKRKCKGAPVMQFTGMKDKNGTDIYEGDIVQFILSESFDYDEDLDYEKYGSKPQTAVVRWSDDAYGFRMNFGSRFKICPEMTEVVGNIHEHPNLLTPAERTA